MRIYVVIISVLLLGACSEIIETPSDDELGLDYYPIAIGKSWTYAVDSIIYDPRGTIEIDTYKSKIREEVVDFFVLQDGSIEYRLDVYQNTSDTSGWNLVNAYYIIKNKKELTRIENGLRFIRLVFPIVKNKSWNGNAYINPNTQISITGDLIKAYDNWGAYFYKKTKTIQMVGSHNYADCVIIEEADYEGLIEKRYSTATYAKSIGPVYREMWILDSQNVDDSIPWEQRAEKGFITTYELLSHN